VRRTTAWMIGGIAVAAVAFYWGPLRWLLYAPPGYVPDGYMVTISIWLAWIWIAIFIGAVAFARWRALWLVLVAPFALYWPAMWIFVGRACDFLGRCR
jgi:hypothetical protein